MCLPRPLSPPVHRLSMSKSTSLEYGFPSTHSTNSISVALFVVAVTCESVSPEARALIKLGAIVYAGSVVMGRIYCGMHTFTGTLGEKNALKTHAYIIGDRCCGWFHSCLYLVLVPVDI